MVYLITSTLKGGWCKLFVRNWNILHLKLSTSGSWLTQYRELIERCPSFFLFWKASLICSMQCCGLLKDKDFSSLFCVNASPLLLQNLFCCYHYDFEKGFCKYWKTVKSMNSFNMTNKFWGHLTLNNQLLPVSFKGLIF